VGLVRVWVGRTGRDEHDIMDGVWKFRILDEDDGWHMHSYMILIRRRFLVATRWYLEAPSSVHLYPFRSYLKNMLHADMLK
jgi:hypothetical protein